MIILILTIAVILFIYYNKQKKKRKEMEEMAKTKKILHEEIRAKYMAMLSNYLAEQEEEVLVVGSNEIAIPCLDSEGNDEYMVITFKVPTGSRDGDAYDGYSMAEDYAIKVREQVAKAEKAKADKEKKIAKDKAMREQKAKAKAEREATKAEG
jgi:dihydrofolate reductase